MKKYASRKVDARRLYVRDAPSMFAYCTGVLHLSEHEAYARITAARASRRYPALLPMLEDGRRHLSAIGKLAPHLTDANAEELLARVAHLTKSEIEELVAEIAPRGPPQAAGARGCRSGEPTRLRPGGTHDPENVCLMCRRHNAYEAELEFGKEHIERYRRRAANR